MHGTAAIFVRAESAAAPASFRQPSGKRSKMLQRRADPGALPRARAKPSPTVASPGWPCWRKKGQMGAACQPAGFASAGCRGEREEYLDLSHLHRTLGLGPRWVPAARASWQHVLAPRRGCVLMLIDSKMPLLCSVREVASKRGASNVCEELRLNGLNGEAHYCCIKRRKKSREKENQVFLSLLCICRT